MKAPLFPMEASEKGASGSQISPGEEKYIHKIHNSVLDTFFGSRKLNQIQNFFKRIIKDQ